MSLKVKDITKIMENYAPSKFKEDYDNVGLMVGDKNDKVTGILIALDCTLDVIDEAVKKKCNLIITHHPLLFRKPSTITTDTLLGRKIIELVKNGINLYSSHTNLDSVRDGVNEQVMKILGFESYTTMDLANCRDNGDSVTGIGRIAKLQSPMIFGELIHKVKESLELLMVRVAGSEERVINKVAVVNGSGQDYFALSKKMGADCIITGDTTYHYVSDFNEENLCIIDAGHFNTEWPAIKIIAQNIQNLIKGIGYDIEITISDLTRDPYKFK
ncbi:Nif3-like dinuclear metal center hexameric protein [Clostridium sediminicola]|uniref:Nif3-like dinuclear metal center hexameric protein n=1 Tax=Clostridium sediminicola TaxID=3114879 RepID=UPI0031F21C4F